MPPISVQVPNCICTSAPLVYLLLSVCVYWNYEIKMNDIEISASDPGVVVYEYELKIGWGKSVSLPSQALPAPPPGHMAIRSKEVSFIFPKAIISNN